MAKAKYDTQIEFPAYCECGKELEQIISNPNAPIRWPTFKACTCQKPEEPQDREEPEEDRLSRCGGRRGERST